MKTAIKSLAAVIVLALACAPASAALIGDSVDASLQGGSGFSVLTQFSPTNAVVGPGVEFAGQLSVFGTPVDVTLDFDNLGFTATFLSTSNAFLTDGGGINVSSVDWPNAPGSITGITPDPGNPSGISFSNVTPDSFDIKIGTSGGPINLSANQPSVHRFTFVPEPTSAALLGLGGLMLARRRRTRSTDNLFQSQG